MNRLSWRWWSRNKFKSVDDTEHSPKKIEGGDRRQLLQALSAIAGSGALAAMSQPADAKDSSELPPPKRALTGRDTEGVVRFTFSPAVIEVPPTYKVSNKVLHDAEKHGLEHLMPTRPDAGEGGDPDGGVG